MKSASPNSRPRAGRGRVFLTLRIINRRSSCTRVFRALVNRLVEDSLGEAKPLVHVRHDLDHLTDEIAILVLDNFGDEARADRLAVFVELYLAVRRFEYERRQCSAVFFLTIAEIAADLVEREERGLRLVVIIGRAKRGAGEASFEISLVRSLPGRPSRMPAISDRPRCPLEALLRRRRPVLPSPYPWTTARSGRP